MRSSVHPSVRSSPTCPLRVPSGERHGLAPETLSAILSASSGRNWSLEVYNPMPGVMPSVPASNGYAPGFMVDLMVKDLGLAMEVAADASARASSSTDSAARHGAVASVAIHVAEPEAYRRSASNTSS